MVAVSKSSVLGAAGERYVMCQMLRLGLIAALAPAGVPHMDILVTDAIGDRACAILTKDCPVTTISSIRFKKIMGKVGSSTAGGVKDILVDVVSEAAKKAIWGV